MSSKSRRSISSWVTCSTCQSIVAQKDADRHQSNCPPNDSSDYNYIHEGVLHGTIEVYKGQEQLKNISEREINDMIFLSQAALQFLEIPIGDPVEVSTKDTTVIKTAWPTADKTLLSISLTKQAMELNALEGSVVVRKLKNSIRLAKEIVVVIVGKSGCSLKEVVTEMYTLLKCYNENKLFCVGNKVSVPFYGKKLIYKIVEVISDGNSDILSEELQQLSLEESQVNIYRAIYSTKWRICDEQKKVDDVRNSRIKSKIEELGGYDDLIADVKDVLDIGLGKCKTIGDFSVSKGVLLHGTAGVGKSMIASALISKYEITKFTIHSSDIYCKTMGETEKKLKDIFTEARMKAPSIILIEDIDSLCPRRSSTTTENERRIVAQLITLFDDIQNMNDDVVVLATTSKIDYVDPSLRRPGRIDKEFEVYVPIPKMRTDILLKLLSKIPNTLTKDDIADISFITHGYVGADLYGLCSQAVINAIKRQQKSEAEAENSPNVTMDDFNHALTVTRPSAMKEVLVEVPNVRWSDIGGQHDLKLKLIQAVEWPLRHPEAFIRMGITPPRGVLMFGPPGCSKTMIAKALATESKVNFLNIKGSELFSKWVGESEKAVRQVFQKARQVAPSIVFIDEIDALGRERSSSSASSGTHVQERVLAQLLTELDGVTALGNVTLVAATNRPDKIDKALLRPGRLDRIIYVRLPDYETRQEIFHIKVRNMPIADDVHVQDLVDLTEGYTGAEIQAICHEAAMKALEEDLNANIITKEHFKAALSIVTPRTPASLISLYDDYINKIF